MACIAMRPALLVVLAVLGPRASAQLEYEEGSGAVSGNISGNGSVNGSSICSLCQGAINENDDGPEWLAQESHVNPDVMTACAVAIIRACYLDGMNMPSSLCEDDAYPIADALGGGGSPELNDPNFDFNSLTGLPVWPFFFASAGNWLESNCGSGPSPAPMPSPYPYPGQWDDWTVSGDCVVHGPCVCSSNFPGGACNGEGNPLMSWGRRLDHGMGMMNMGTYQNGESCQVQFHQPMELSVYNWDIEWSYDTTAECMGDALTVNGEKYCGSNWPDRAGQITDALSWSSDGSNSNFFGNSGFKICTSPSAWPTLDASCPPPQDNWVEAAVSVTSGSWASEVSWTLSCPGMCDIEGGAPEYGEMLHSVPPGADCSLKMKDSYGDGWNGAVWSAAGWTSMSFSLAYGYTSTEFFTAPAVAIAAPTPPPPFTAPSPPPPPAPCSSWDESWPEAAVSVSEGGWASEVSWTLSCVGMCDVIQGGAPYDGMHSVPPGAECTLEMLDSWGDGWNGAIWWSGFSDEAGYTLETGSFETISFAANTA